ncbi:MAG: SRPBCC family protein [Bacteroidota bacterium]
MIRVPAEVRRTFRLAVPAPEAFTLMRDVPRWARLFPNVESVQPLPEAGEDAYVWTMEPLGPPGVQVRTVYACRYTFDAEGLQVNWVPVPGEGNATFTGGVAYTEDGPEADGALWLEAELEIPAPRFVAGVVRAALTAEFGRMTDRFLRRLSREVRRL